LRVALIRHCSNSRPILVEVRHTDSFGITQLRLRHDPRLNLADGTLPLADWEWLWWTRLGRTQRRKLLQTHWGKPYIESGEDWIHLHFCAPNEGPWHRR
jgi:hypothetical protein